MSSLAAYPFVVPNVATAHDNPAPFVDFQAWLDALDLVIMAAASQLTGVVDDGSGNYGAVGPQGSPNMTVRVAASTDSVRGTTYGCPASTSLSIAANASGNPRFDLVVSDHTGSNYVVQGTPAAQPDFPSLTLDADGCMTQVVKGAVYVPDGVGSIAAANIISKRMLLELDTSSDLLLRAMFS